MIEVQKWQCSLCRFEFDSEGEAAVCEARGVPTPKYHSGQEIRFQTERQSLSRWVYSSASGEILGGYLMKGFETHIWLYVVPVMGFNLGVLEGNDGDLTSPAEAGDLVWPPRERPDQLAGFTKELKGER